MTLKDCRIILKKRQKYFTSKQVELKGVQENVKKLNDRMEQLKQCILMLESECLAKNIDPKDTSNHAQEFVMALKQRVKSKNIEDASRLREVMDDTSLVANLIQDFKQNL